MRIIREDHFLRAVTCYGSTVYVRTYNSKTGILSWKTDEGDAITDPASVQALEHYYTEEKMRVKEA